MLRLACALLTHTLTVILAPYFVHVGKCDAEPDGLGFGAYCPAPYIMACLWVLITTLLLNVQVRARHRGPTSPMGCRGDQLRGSRRARKAMAPGERPRLQSGREPQPEPQPTPGVPQPQRVARCLLPHRRNPRSIPWTWR